MGVFCEIPKGFIAGMDRSPKGRRLVTHLYRGTLHNPGNPMCKRGWNRGEYGYSIWRGNISEAGICEVCLRRARARKKGIRFPYANVSKGGEG